MAPVLYATTSSIAQALPFTNPPENPVVAVSVNNFTMSDEEGQELVTKPFKFVTGKEQ